MVRRKPVKINRNNSGGLLDPKITSLTLASVFGVVYILCALLFALFPFGMMMATSNLFHGFNMMAIARTTMMGGGNILFGLIEVMLIGLFIGWLYARLYNYFTKNVR